MMRKMIDERDGRFYAIDERYCIDNGLMIAHAGLEMYKSGIRFDLADSTITQR